MSSKVISLPDTSLNGVMIWLSLLIVLGLFSILLFEYLRNHPRYTKVYYTRLTKTTSGRILHPSNRFGWIFQVFSVPEGLMLEEIGLDAVMYLRYLGMCFRLFSVIMVLLFIILIPVNYAATSEQQSLNITESGTILEIANDALSSISMSRIQNGSNLLWVHCICAYMVSGITFYFLYHEYLYYVTTASKCLREPQDRLEKLQQRTILLTNLPRNLRTKLALEKWLLNMDIGKISSIYMNTKQDEELLKLIQEYKEVVYQLETAYMQWCINVYKSIRYPLVKSYIRIGTTQRIALMDEKMSDQDFELAKKVADQCRPLYISKTKSKTRDVIKFLNQRTNELENLISMKRSEQRELVSVTRTVPDTTLDVMYGELKASSASAFITFKSNKSAFMALQMKLDSSMDGYSMQVKPAPLPNDVLWNNLTKSLWDRKIKRAALSLVSMAICIGWVVPTYYISRLSFIGLPGWVDTNPILATIVESVVPPILILTCASLIPYVLDFLSVLQCFDSLNNVQEATFAKYFYFLMFNVHFVFTLLSAAVTSMYKLFVNPLEWVQAIAQSFPAGGSFFINYLILNLIVFPIELLRPGPVLYYLILRWYNTTPRDFQKLSESASILNYGFLYPMHCLLFIVVLCYSIISPIVVLPGTIYFGTAWLVYKNQLMYVYVKQSEGRGRLWKMVYHRTIAGLFIFQFLIAGLLSTKLAPLQALFTGLLIPITVLFYKYCKACFHKHDVVIPLEYLSNASSPGAESVVDLSVFESSPTRSNSPLKIVTDTDDEIKLTPRTERANVRVNQDYQCPSVSKPLPNIWMPAYIARLVEEEEEGDVDSAGQSIHSRHSVMESGKWTSINELNRDQ